MLCEMARIELEPDTPLSHELRARVEALPWYAAWFEGVRARARDVAEGWRQDECRKAEARLLDSVRVLEFMEQHALALIDCIMHKPFTEKHALD